MCLKAAAALGKLHLPSSPQVLFALLHQTQSLSAEGWHQLMEEKCFQPRYLPLAAVHILISDPQHP